MTIIIMIIIIIIILLMKIIIRPIKDVILSYYSIPNGYTTVFCHWIFPRIQLQLFNSTYVYSPRT